MKGTFTFAKEQYTAVMEKHLTLAEANERIRAFNETSEHGVNDVQHIIDDAYKAVLGDRPDPVQVLLSDPPALTKRQRALVREREIEELEPGPMAIPVEPADAQEPQLLTRKQKRIVTANDLVTSYQHSLDKTLIESPVSLNAMKLAALMLSLVYPRKDDPFQPLHVHAKELYKRFGLAYAPKRKEAQALILNIRHLVSLVTKEGTDTTVAWVDVADYDPAIRTFTVKLSEQLRPYICNLRKKFTTQYLAEIFALQSPRSIRLYGFVRQYARMDKETHREPIEKVIWVLAVPLEHSGITNWARLDQDIIKPAWQEIQAKTSLRFAYRPVRANPKAKRGPVVAVEFFAVHQLSPDEQEEQAALEKDLANDPAPI